METQKFIDLYQADLNKAKSLFLLTEERISQMTEEYKLDLDFTMPLSDKSGDKISLREYYRGYNTNIEELFTVSAEILLISYVIEKLPEETAIGVLNAYSELFTDEGLTKATEAIEGFLLQANADFEFFNKLNDFCRWAMEEAIKDRAWTMTDKQVLEERLAKNIFNSMYSAWSMQSGMLLLTKEINRYKK